MVRAARGPDKTINSGASMPFSHARPEPARQEAQMPMSITMPSRCLTCPLTAVPERGVGCILRLSASPPPLCSAASPNTPSAVTQRRRELVARSAPRHITGRERQESLYYKQGHLISRRLANDLVNEIEQCTSGKILTEQKHPHAAADAGARNTPGFGRCRPGSWRARGRGGGW